MTRACMTVFTFMSLLLSADLHALAESQLHFGARVNGIENRYPVFGVFAAPDRLLNIELMDLASHDAHVSFDGVPVKIDDRMFQIRMPDAPGTHQLDISDAAGQLMRLNVFVMWQHDNAFAMLNGYRIGSYPNEPLKGLSIYHPPSAFVEVTGDNARMAVSPNFTLGQFVCKQGSGYPKYLVLRPELVQKLELLLGELRKANVAAGGLTVMSGYRTPTYNRTIGNGQYSRHLWGGAADIYVDEGKNGVMDDLNGDGRVSGADATWLAGFLDKLEREGTFGQLIGGVGTYDSTPSHGPFVHVDARGFRARW